MTPEERSLLERTYKLTEENNEILRKMRRANRFSLALRIGYWVIILGLTVGAFYFIQPYVDALIDTYTSVFGAGTADASTTQSDMSSLLELLR
ncbi:MAG: hypothetical protein AAB365_01670 [Patescibacteria group bacterium]